MQRPKLWKSLERLPGLGLPRLGWSAVLGEELALVDSYLRPTSRLAEVIPCLLRCTPKCKRRVVRCGPNDYVAVCPQGSPKYAVAEADLIVQELNVAALAGNLAKALGLDGAVEPVSGISQTWLLGYYPTLTSPHHPVYLTVQQDPTLLRTAAIHICLGNHTPFALLVPTASMLDLSVRRTIKSKQSAWVALDKTVRWLPEGKVSTDLDLAELFVFGPRERWASGEVVEPPPKAGQVLLERKAMPDGVHWIVGGRDKGVFYKRKDAIKGRILEILFEQIGNGFIPHKTFMSLCGWTEKHYLAKGSAANLIQKHLTDIRSFLGVKVLFRIDEGVCFDANIVKPR